MNYRAAKKYILDRLRTELSVHLYYHGLHHTVDVLKMATQIALEEGVRGRDLMLVKTAALYHDCGFVKNKHAGHEAEGCIIVREQLPQLGYTDAAIEKMCGMIMATKIPQKPSKKLEYIIADADLEYLGTNDFERIGRTLFEEIKLYLNVESERQWNIIQMNFLKSHHYFTAFCKKHREAQKKKHLSTIEKIVATYE